MAKTLQAQATQETETTFRTSDGMFTVSSDQKIKSWNKSAELIFGIPADQAIGKKCYELLCARGGSNRVECARGCVVMANAAKGRTTKDFDLQCRTSTGEQKTLNMSVVLSQSQSRPTEVLHFFRDVTDKRKVENASVGRNELTAGSLRTNSTTFKVPPLTVREEQVLKLLAAGKNTQAIAEVLGIRPLTARNHVSRLLTKLGCRSRLEAVAVGTQAGLL